MISTLLKKNVLLPLFNHMCLNSGINKYRISRKQLVDYVWKGVCKQIKANFDKPGQTVQ